MNLLFWDTLFDYDDHICLASDVTGTQVYSPYVARPEFIPPGTQFFSINGLHTKRLDANVTKFRNFLLEIDDMPLTDQWIYVSNLNIPYSTVVFSGNRSYHFIISLETPLANKTEYDLVAKRLHAAVPNADKSTKNPSRLSRCPDVMRDNGKLQELMEPPSPRVSNTHFMAWLEERVPSGILTPVRPPVEHTQLKWNGINKFTKYFLAFGAEDGAWNSTLFAAACDMARNGYSMEEAAEAMERITGHLDSSDRTSLASAFKTVNRE
jgi:hypothetical protein